ncbi:MAG TPA: type VI secretion system membrane subunit TssM [Sandaracinaceae bacterium LLY-WYZ-13_1]|nr:type VI secretion system membrane subunit TssM [Sandaracinaceae bacterium LLY-WYZ-13_1]
MLKYIVAAILIVAAWVAWLLLAPFELWWAPALFTVLVIAVLGAILIARRLRARRAARELEKALAAQAAEQARTARPDMQAEILQMQQEFQKAIAALKSSKIARGGENALYALPWNLIVGPPGAGKTTALRNSGLQFPYMSTSGGGVRGVGGTRNCDWWLTNEAVLLDTAGRWTTEEEDRDEWHAFLDLIKKFRPEKPLNGIIAAVSLDQLGGAHEEEVASLARRMRERVDEVQNRLQMSLPVYVLFTKADLVPGFVETFGDLSKQERGQVWGFTVPLADPPSDPGAHFGERFDELADVVQKRSLRRMGEERKIETRELIHSFPQQFVSLRRNCEMLVSQLFESSVFGETPMFRGCYFTSGTQEGRPIDRVMHKMAEAFGIRSEVQLGEPVTEAKSYFLRDVFLNVVFPDKDVATRSEAAVKRQRRNTYVAAGLIFAAALLISVLPAIAWANNQGFLDEVREDVDQVAEASAGAGPLTPEEIRPLRERVQQLQEYDDAQPFLMSMGMYQDDVLPAISDYYTDLVRSEVVQPIVAQDADAMDDFGRRYESLRDSIPTGPEHAANYDRLKMHLLVTRPTEEGEPPLSDEEAQDWLTDHIARRWVDAMGGDEQVTEETREEMERHARLFARLLGEEDDLRLEDPTNVQPEDSLRFPREDDTVERTRRALTRVSLTDMALERIIQEIEPMDYGLTLANLVGNTVPPMQSDGEVRGAFTRRAWDTRVREMLESEEGGVFGEPWVLGREAEVAQRSAEQREEDLRVLRNEYFRTYIEEWRDFLRSIRVIPPQGNTNTLVSLQHLTRGDPEPYRLLFQQVLYNTLLPVPESEQEDGEDSAVEETAWDVFWRRVRRVRGGQAIARILRGADLPGGEEEEEEDLTPEHVYLAFEGFTEFGAVPPPPPPAEGQEPPPPPELPVGTYEEQLHSVRDALQAHLDTPQGTEEALQTSLQTARTTTRGLIEGQEIGWRPRLEALLWPPIEGAAGSVAMDQASGAGRSWCSEVYMPYHRNILGGYPLNPSGHDVPLADFAAFYAPQEGTLWTFYNEVLERRIPKEGDQFVFAQNLGQQASRAYRRQLLQYLERANEITNVFFPPGAEGPQVQFDARIRPSPRVATTELCIGGVCNEYHNGPERWTRYTWPGDSPEAGASLEVRGADMIREKLEQTGEWGLFRLLEQGTVTERSSGNRVFTITWRLRDHQVDVPVQIRPVRGDAPFFGIRGRTRNPQYLQPMRGNHVDPPQQIVSGRTTCRVR